MAAPPDPNSFFDRHWRWFVLGTLFLATFLNYLDRQTLSGAADPICREFGLDNTQRGELLARFVYFYAAAHLIVGPLLDRVTNLRLVFPIFVLGWSASNLLVAFARDYSTLLWLRSALGIFEAANFPVCLLLIVRIFPPAERVLANGIFYSGAVIATLVAPKFVIYFATHHHWRWAFLITGSLGILWLVPWLLIYRDPEKRAQFWPAGTAATGNQAEKIQVILGKPAFWGVVLVGMGIIPGLYFMTQWLPSYLTQVWNVPYDQALGNRLLLVSLCQDLGMWLGGTAVMLLARRGRPLLSARRTVIVAAYCCMMSILLLAHVSSINGAIMLFCCYVFGLGAWLANQQAFKQDVTRGSVATVVGLVGFAETALSAYLVQKTGMITQQDGGYGMIFVAFAALFSFALCMVFIFMRERFLPVHQPMGLS